MVLNYIVNDIGWRMEVGGYYPLNSFELRV